MNTEQTDAVCSEKLLNHNMKKSLLAAFVLCDTVNGLAPLSGYLKGRPPSILAKADGLAGMEVEEVVLEPDSDSEPELRFDMKQLAGVTAPLGFFDPLSFSAGITEGRGESPTVIRAFSRSIAHWFSVPRSSFLSRGGDQTRPSFHARCSGLRRRGVVPPSVRWSDRRSFVHRLPRDAVTSILASGGSLASSPRGLLSVHVPIPFRWRIVGHQNRPPSRCANSHHIDLVFGQRWCVVPRG